MFFFIAFCCFKFGNSQAVLNGEIGWDGIKQVTLEDVVISKYLSFENGNYKPSVNAMVKSHQVPFTGPVGVVKLVNAKFEDVLNKEELAILSSLSIDSNIDLNYQVRNIRKNSYLLIEFLPIIKTETGYKKLISYEVEITKQSLAKRKLVQKRTYTQNSVFATGNIYKISITKTGVYKIDYNDLESLGIISSSVNPKNIQLYGNGGGMLPHSNAEFRYDDVIENAIEVVGGEDGVFNKNDYILFYGYGPHKTIYNSTSNLFSVEKNLYSDKAYYFLKIGTISGKRMAVDSTHFTSTPTNTVNEYQYYTTYEQDLLNLLKSGRNWYGEEFNETTLRTFNFSIPNLITSKEIKLFSEVAARSSNLGAANNFTISNNSVNIGSLSVPTVNFGVYWSTFAEINSYSGSFFSSSPNLNLTYSYNKPLSTSIAWLDNISINATSKLVFNGSQLNFYQPTAVSKTTINQYSVSNNSSNLKVWSVKSPNQISELPYNNINGTLLFNDVTDSLHSYVVFNTYLDVELEGLVANQNLHALPQTNFVIVTHPDLKSEAERLGQYHLQNDNLSYVVVTTNQIYNEFSSGAQDVAAIRDFMKMFYDRAGTDSTQLPKYLLLFGDASYDPKNRVSNNTNYVISYQSENSSKPTESYASDDFFGLLDDTEGAWNNFDGDAVDIGIGRFPVRNLEEAKVAVDKVIAYGNATTYGDWRNKIVFVADDEDGNLHIRDANSIAIKIDTNNASYNLNKIYFDAFQQESTSSGQRYPDVKNAINSAVNNGSLIVNYTGHGGEVGWAKERVLELSDINAWENLSNMPLFITATCEFSRYDDPDRQAAGEQVFLNAKGGGIALLSTVRLVFSGPNFTLNNSVYDYIFSPDANGKMPRLGDVFRKIKTQPANINVNSRNFTLLGDPALRLAYPEKDIKIETINGKNINAVTDTLNPLSKVVITGSVLVNGVVDNEFNGIIYPTIYDKPQDVNTLQNDGTASFTFQTQNNRLYTGKASVVNGRFEFSFVVPKDISFQSGFGKMSFYASANGTDASGSYENFVVGGKTDTTNTDSEGPRIELFLNDESFVSGGLTNEAPLLLVNLSDSSGINTLGTSIGHNITAVIDDNTASSIVLNAFYEAALNTYTKGVVNYNLKSLLVGRHNLRVKAWDVFNNSSEEKIEFIVENSANLALQNVLNYPNPFTTKTNFFFEHNKPATPLNVKVEIMTVGGQVIKTITSTINTTGFRSDFIEWNGKDDYGSFIGKGVYIYKLTVSSATETVEEYQKLVILK